MRAPRSAQEGQAAVEALGLVVFLLVAVLVGWQLVAAVVAASVAQDDARRRALAAPGAGRVTVTARRPLPRLLPFTGRPVVRVRAVTEGRG